ncbi:kelch repeat-containing protein [Bacillus sp. PsM16]|uniref:Kelch repeat-containing protein n=1 Tax=Bacillus sp. PsM16 TaxID=3031172 RepID=UPI00263A5C32|nr:kelch repeat-containing protein [Bacillus sp. PsM16]MDN4635103.1 kelch repeat-containing protein [Bacillus sp. PsM16]
MKKLIVMMLLVILSFTQIFQVANAAKDEWNQLADLPTARIGAVANAVDGNIYVIGGFNALNETLEYNPSTNQWTKMKDIPSGRGGAASVVVGSKIYVLAGNHQNSFNKFEVYDTKKDEWEVLTDIPFESPSKGAYNVQAGVMGDKIYVLGGNEFFSYDLTENKWKKEASPSFKTQRAIGLVLKGKFYIIGENNNSEIFEFDASNDSWSAKKGGFKKVYLSGVTYKDNMILPGISPNRLYVYNAEKEEMVKVVVPNNDIRVGASSVIIGDMLYVIGGRQYNINLNYTDVADRNYKSVISISLKDLEFPNNTETPGDKDPEPTTPPKDDDATDEDGDALLIITMVNGLQKEYDLSMKEVNAFLSWYKKRDAGEGPGFYEIDEHDNNKGPFESKKDYVVFNNILMFEVNKYKK